MHKMLFRVALCGCAFASCVLTVWASIRNPVSIEDQRLFETKRLEQGHQNPRCT